MTNESQKLPIILSLATNRDDKGQTDNYRVYAGGGQVQVRNKKGELVTKNTLVGSNGTLYIANPVAGQHERWLLMPEAMYKQLTTDAPKVAKGGSRAKSK